MRARISSAAAGTPVFAPAAGTVVLAEKLFVRGNAVVLDHGGGVYTGYWHLSELDVKPGEQVAPGQRLGLVGSTGSEHRRASALGDARRRVAGGPVAVGGGVGAGFLWRRHTLPSLPVSRLSQNSTMRARKPAPTRRAKRNAETISRPCVRQPSDRGRVYFLSGSASSFGLRLVSTSTSSGLAATASTASSTAPARDRVTA